MPSLRRSSAFSFLTSSSLALVVTALLGLGATRCSSSSAGGANTPSEASAAGSFRGVLTGPDDLAGVLDLTSTASGTSTQTLRAQNTASSTYVISGTLTLNVAGLGPVSLAGTLDLTSNTVTFTGAALGGTVTFRGTYAAGTLRGTATLPNGSEAPFTASNRALGVKTYCGSFAGGLSGRWSMLETGDQLGVVFVASDRRVGRGTGTLDSAKVATLSLEPSGSAVGTASAGSIDGTWDFAGERGAFAASESACNALTPQGTLPDGGVLDGGTPSDDAGAPSQPEDLHTTAGTVAISNLAIDGAKLYFSLDHPYFSQTLTIRSVGIDGAGAADVVPTGTAPVLGGLTATGGRVYWISGANDNDTNLRSIANAGGALTDHGVIGNASNSDYVAGVPRIITDGTSIFVTWDGPSNRGVRSYSLAGVAGSSVTDLAGPKAVAIDGADLWMSDFDGLKRGPKTVSPAPTLLVPRADYGDLAFVVGITFDATNVYFTTNTTSASALWRRAKAGGPIEPVVASTPGRFRGLAILDQNLYFARTTSGGQQGGSATSLLRVAKNATNAQPVTVDAANIGPIVSDGTWLYWASATKIRRLHK